MGKAGLAGLRLVLIMMALVCASAYAELRFVHQQGRYVVTPDGKRLMLRGINLGNWLEPEGYMFQLEGGSAVPTRDRGVF